MGQYFVDLRDAGGQSLGYVYDIETELFPIGVDGSLSPHPCPIRVHVATEFDGPGVLLGTQQHLKWRMETSHRSGLKTIEVSPGIDYVFPFSTRPDGGAGGADRVEALPPVGVVEVAPTAEPLPQDPVPLGGARITSGGRPSLGEKELSHAALMDRALLPLLPPLGLLKRALARRDLGLLEKYGDGLALIESAFT